ncbi:hypothetical protein PR048_023032 [Dryococelus australis]|uniref:Uncharacterized protein n=1 Tax=Dryococelus australis TaxID=614101 RepID=A0ABQ9GT19_9NEOP|nr:hypothetical protein PR048_023032 [Dryococelus australis]
MHHSSRFSRKGKVKPIVQEQKRCPPAGELEFRKLMSEGLVKTSRFVDNTSLKSGCHEQTCGRQSAGRSQAGGGYPSPPEKGGGELSAVANFGRGGIPCGMWRGVQLDKGKYTLSTGSECETDRKPERLAGVDAFVPGAALPRRSASFGRRPAQHQVPRPVAVDICKHRQTPLQRLFTIKRALSKSTHAHLPPRRSGFNTRPGHSEFSHVGIVPVDAVGRRAFLASPASPAPSFRCRFILTSIIPIGSQDLDVKSRPNYFTHVYGMMSPLFSCWRCLTVRWWPLQSGWESASVLVSRLVSIVALWRGGAVITCPLLRATATMAGIRISPTKSWQGPREAMSHLSL